jgi:hypothetical protein
VHERHAPPMSIANTSNIEITFLENFLFTKNTSIGSITERKCFILIYLLESYKDKINEYCFLKDILKVYESGHLPCGWIGPVEEREIPTIEESIRAVYSSDIDETYKKGILLYY